METSMSWIPPRLDGVSSPARRVQDRVKALIRPLTRKRRFQAVGVGVHKSGTHSIAEMLEGKYRAVHEPEPEEMIRVVLAAAHPGREAAVDDYLRLRDRRLRLELDSSGINIHFLDSFVRLFPEARFILTARDCYSWLESIVNHFLTRPAPPLWVKYRDHCYSGSGVYPPEERILEERRVYPLRGFLSHWDRNYRDVLEKVPANRLLIVRTEEISTSIPRLAAFLGIPEYTFDSSRSHAFKRTRTESILDQLPPDYLNDVVHDCCASMMKELFPDVQGARAKAGV
jgi:hypothetical protein